MEGVQGKGQERDVALDEGPLGKDSDRSGKDTLKIKNNAGEMISMESVITLLLGLLVAFLSILVAVLAKKYGELKMQLQTIDERYKNELKEWKEEVEEQIKKEAISRSAAVILGKVGEQLAPLLLLTKYGINPKDLRFIGSPIDFVAFKGLDEGSPEEILFIEVKSSNTKTLTTREKQVKALVESKRVRWIEIYVQDELKNATDM